MAHRACFAALALIACTHHDDHNVPAPPKDSGITFISDGDGTIVRDSIGGFEIRFPGVPEIAADTTVMPDKGPRTTIQVSEHRPDGLIHLMIVRLHNGDIDESPAALAGIYAAATNGANVIDSRWTTIAGRKTIYVAKRVEQDGVHGNLREWTLVAPDRNAWYQLIMTLADGAADPAQEHVIETWRSVGS